MKILCGIFGHNYKLAQKLNSWSRRVYCARCHKSFGMNDDCRVLIDWDNELVEFYQSIGIEIKYLDGELNELQGIT